MSPLLFVAVWGGSGATLREFITKTPGLFPPNALAITSTVGVDRSSGTALRVYVDGDVCRIQSRVAHVIAVLTEGFETSPKMKGEEMPRGGGWAQNPDFFGAGDRTLGDFAVRPKGPLSLTIAKFLGGVDKLLLPVHPAFP